MVRGESSENKRFYHLIKRVIDIVLSLLGLIVISPIVILIALQIKIDSKGPVFFKHHRIGKNSIPFYMYKFRTMKEGAE
ncbi:MAG: sugar transferase, partial [Candidatus Ornithospirochaeta sp.]